jgi:hypothetical protein
VPITGGRLDDDEFALHVFAAEGRVCFRVLLGPLCHTRNPAHRPPPVSLLQHLDLVILSTTSAHLYAADGVSSR